MEIGRMVGPGYQLGQAMKKAQESTRLPDAERKVAELLGAINYLAAAVILVREGVTPQREDGAEAKGLGTGRIFRLHCDRFHSGRFVGLLIKA